MLHDYSPVWKNVKRTVPVIGNLEYRVFTRFLSEKERRIPRHGSVKVSQACSVWLNVEFFLYVRKMGEEKKSNLSEIDAGRLTAPLSGTRSPAVVNRARSPPFQTQRREISFSCDGCNPCVLPPYALPCLPSAAWCRAPEWEAAIT
jgi:hypothetical protein